MVTAPYVIQYENELMLYYCDSTYTVVEEKLILVKRFFIKLHDDNFQKHSYIMSEFLYNFQTIQ